MQCVVSTYSVDFMGVIGLDCVALAVTLSEFAGIPVMVAGGAFISEVSPYVQEQQLVERAIPARRAEFFSGRFYAHHLLRKLGCVDEPILRGAKGEPLWPDGILGSISHDLDQVVVVLFQSEQKSGFGIDLLLDTTRVESSLEYLIALPGELERLVDLRTNISLLALVFSLKESVVKAVSPGIDHFMDFLEIELFVINDTIQAYIPKLEIRLACEFIVLENGLLSAAKIVDCATQ